MLVMVNLDLVNLCQPGKVAGTTKGKIKMTLDKVVVGDTVKIVRLNGEGPVKRRMMDMGLVKGVEVSVRKIAPLGDPIELTVRGYELSIRKSEAATIEVRSNIFVKSN